MKKILTIIISIMFLLSLLLLAGCGEKKVCPASCDDGNPCTSDLCNKETGNECQNNMIPGCSLDCGKPCTGDVGMYMQMQCDPTTKDCASSIKPGLEIKTESFTNEITSKGNKFKISPTFTQPFNMKKEKFNVKLSLVNFGTGMKDIKVTKLELSGTDENRNTVIISEKHVNKYLWTTDTVIDEDMKVSFPTSDDDGKFTNMKIRITYEYVQDYSGRIITGTESIQAILRGVSFTWARPTMTNICPTMCDDFNDGTSDTCGPQTDNLCEFVPIPGKCGNFICEPATENKCTCAEDCGPCTGSAGSYLDFVCQSDECRTIMKSSVVQQPISMLDDQNRNLYYLQNKYEYNNPFDVSSDSFNIEFKLFNKQDSVEGIKITEVKLLERSNQLASATLNTNLGSIGATSGASLKIDNYAGYESEQSMTLRIDVEYDYKLSSGETEVRRDTISKPLGVISFMNPTYE